MIIELSNHPLYGNQSRTTDNRGSVPYTVFIDPPLSVRWIN